MFGEEKLIWEVGGKAAKETTVPAPKTRGLPQSVDVKAGSDKALAPLVDDLTGDVTGDSDKPDSKSHAKPDAVDQKLSVVEKKEVFSDKLKIEVIEDPVTKFKIRVYRPADQEVKGPLHMYFPGDTHGFSDPQKPDCMAGKTPEFIQSLQAGLRKGKGGVLAVVEGDPECIYKNKEGRYSDIDSSSAVSSILGTIEGHLGKKPKGLHLLGFSRGGSAINRMLKHGGLGPEVQISCLDSTYFSTGPLIAHAKAGGRLNIAVALTGPQKRLYKAGSPLSEVAKASPDKKETFSEALEIINSLGLKEVTKGRWASANGKVQIYISTGLGHRGVAKAFSPQFMGDSDGLEAVDLPSQLAQQIEYNGEHLDDFLKRLEEVKKDPKKMQEFLDWAAQQTDMDILRRADVLVGDNIRDHYLKHLKLAAAFLQKGTDVNGHASFDVDFKGNDLAEWNIGAGHLLPFTVKAVRVYGKDGGVLFDYAERKVVNGKIGYYVPGTGQYAHVHSGYKIEVLGARPVPIKDTDKEYAEFKQEREIFAVDGERFVIQDYLQKYFRDKLKMDIEVDSQYIVANLAAVKATLERGDADWWANYLTEKFTVDDFEKLFALHFEKKLVAYKNVLALMKQDEKMKTITLTDVENLLKGEKFKGLSEKEFSKEELSQFKAKDMEGKELSEYVKSSPKLIQLIANAAKIAKEREPTTFVDGKCEQAVRQVASRVIELATGKPIGSTDKIRIRNTKIEQAATATMRGKKVSDLSMTDFRGMKPGLAFYIADPKKYAGMGIDIEAGTSGKIPVKNNTDRHWVMWDGVGFTDNHGAARPLGALKRLMGKNKDRVIVSVHDPLGQYGVYDRLYA